MDVLLPKLTPPTSSCQPIGADVFHSLRNLGSLLVDLSSNNDLYYTPQVRQSLQSSAKILSKATTFLDKESHFKFEHFCTTDHENNKDFLTAVGRMMSDLADLYADLGGDIAAKEMRKHSRFTKTIAVCLVDFIFHSKNF